MESSTATRPGDPIAIIGSGCRFPGKASSPSKLWELLSRPEDLLTEIPSSRFNPQGFYNPDGEYHGHSNVLHSYVLAEDIRAFDADFFNVSVAEATAIDPQQRLLMETVYEALEDGGQSMNKLRGSDTAVYVGLMCEEYSGMQMKDVNSLPTYFPTGTARSVVSNRISYFFDWQGPCMTIDTACSSSLVAVHQAVQTLRSRASRMAVAAGTNLILGPEAYIAESTFHMLSPRGRSQMWDACADGYGRGEGVGAVVLKRLSDALADGDHVECIIRETGVNQDGRTKGITVPSAEAQIALIEQTYRRAGLDLDMPQGRPQFFEAHGTGTPAGDPIEAEAIHRSIGRRIGAAISADEKLCVGSIKTVVGHTEGTAGIAGLIKVSQALQNKAIPPNLLFKNLAPAIEPFYRNVNVPSVLRPWPKTVPGAPRRASLNSFGFGGTNAHAIVESYEPEPALISNEATGAQLLLPFTFSAVSRSSLKRIVKEFIEFLDKSRVPNLNDLAYSLGSRRSIFPYRVSYSGLNRVDLRHRIQASLSDSSWDTTTVTRATPSSTNILGIFTGQGAQWATMGKELINLSPHVQSKLAFLDSVLASLPDSDRPSWSLRTEILAENFASKLDIAALSQPICTALQIILVDLLAAAGITFATVVGHSSGEIAAAYACGAITARDAILVAYYRGVHSEFAASPSGEKGAMLALSATEEDVSELCSLPDFEGRIGIAARNSPTSFTISGDTSAIEEAKLVLEDEGKFARILRVDKAYHSHHMIPCTEGYAESLRKAQLTAGKPRSGCKWVSSVDVRHIISGTEDLDAFYWCRNMTQPVQFSSAIESALATADAKFTLAVEIGPHSALKGPVEDILNAAERPSLSYVPVLLRNENAIQCFAAALGSIWKNTPEASVDLQGYYRVMAPNTKHTLKLVKGLPAYQWDHSRTFWSESRRSKVVRTRANPGHPMLGNLSPDSTELDLIWQNVLRVSELPWLTGHQLQGQVVFPAAGYVALAIEAGVHIAGRRPIALIELQDVRINKAITFEDEKTGVEILMCVHVENMAREYKHDSIVAGFRLYSSSRDSDTTYLIASGKVKLLLGSRDPIQQLLPCQEAEPSRMVDVDEDEFYTELRKLGYQYSNSFRALTSMRRKLGSGRGLVRKPSGVGLHISETRLLVHPGFLDAVFQGIFLAYSWPGDGSLWSLHVPTSIHRLQVDPSSCGVTGETELRFDSSVSLVDRAESKTTISGDVNIYSADGSRGILQVEGLGVVPFGAAPEAQDTLMFYDNIYGVLNPDGELARGGDRAPEHETIRAWALERISYYYLRRLVLDIKPEEEAMAEWHNRKLLSFARLAVQMMEDGKLRYGKKIWNHDTPELLNQAVAPYEDLVEVRLMRAVGENMLPSVRGETHMLQHMMKDGMLNQFYIEGLGMESYTTYLTEIVAQIMHRYPHARIIEIGAGTGGATKRVTRRVKDSFKDYTFTDISSGFFENARNYFSEFAGRMTFKVLDAEKDVHSQGFQDHTYDIAIASLVLHATRDLNVTLRNVRKLLKPGGYLIMLEVTSNDILRTSFTMGGLPGWWLGADSGRTWSPCVTALEWHELLLQSGFSGVEASTPEDDMLPRPFGVLLSRAVDDRLRLLIEPSADTSPVSDIRDLIIVTGTALETIRLSQAVLRILKKHCKSIATVKTLDEVAAMKTPPALLSVLSLIEVEQPVFKELSPASFKGLKHLFSMAQNVIWVTRGAADTEPYANITIGLGRAVKMEMPHIRMQFIDFDADAKLNAYIIADELLRLQVLGSVEKDGCDILWSQEMEVRVDSTGRMVIPRIKPNHQWNNSYNSSRRDIFEEVNPHTEPVRVQEVTSSGYRLGRYTLANTSGFNVHENMVNVQVQYTASSPVPIGTTSLYPMIGLDLSSRKQVITLSDTLGSIVQVAKRSTIPFEGSNAGFPESFIEAMSAYLLSYSIIDNVENNANILLVNLNPAFIVHFKALAANKTINVRSLSSSPDLTGLDSTYLHPLASKEIIRQTILGEICVVVYAGSSEFVNRLTRHLPNPPGIVNVHAFQARMGSASRIADAYINVLHDSVKAATQVKIDARSSIQLAESFVKVPMKGAIIDWITADKISLPLPQPDSVPLCRPDRTYLLFGLGGSGGLGLSLAEWLVTQGARYIILTSRNPKSDPVWVAKHAAQGTRIELIPNDVTDFPSLEALVTEVRRSWPPIAGVSNGAMVLYDTPLDAMTYDQMVRVLSPKVDGTRFLDKLFHDDQLEFFVLFSSLSSVFGNSGQANYAASNMYEIAVCSQRRRRGVVASVIDVGAIMGVGYMAREVGRDVLSHLVEAGYRKMSERDFHVTFAHAILAGRIGSTQPEELIMGLYSVTRSDDRKLAWTSNPRFSHVVKSSSGKIIEAVEAHSGTTPPRQLLKRANTEEQVKEIITDSVLHKLRLILQLQAEDPGDPRLLLEQTADDLGVDSLVAVEIRSWFLKELDVSIPVLKIIGGGTMADLVDYAIESLPEELIPAFDNPVPISSERDSAETMPSERSIALSTPSDKSALSTVNGKSETSLSEPPPPSQTSSVAPKEKSLAVAEVEVAVAPSGSTTTPLNSNKATFMSSGQARFWFMSHFVSDQSAFNVTGSFRITGELNLRSLAAAVRALGQRHEALRTYFFYGKSNIPMQGVLSESLLHLETKEIKAEEDFHAEFRRLDTHVFQLGRGETIRAVLLTQSRTLHHLVVAYHHINMDSTSLGVIMSDLMQLYAGVDLPPPRLQYTDFSELQRRRLLNGEWRKEIAFWRKEFEDLPEPLPILSVSSDTPRHRPAIATYRQVKFEFRVPSHLASKVRPLCRKIAVTPFHFYCAVFQVLLARLGGTEDVCIGVADANRSERNSLEAVGNFMTLFPVRLHTPLAQTFSSIAKETKKKILMSMANSAVTFDTILDEVGAPRSPAHSPLFQVFIDYRMTNEKGYLGNAEIEGELYSLSETPYDIMLDIVDNPTGNASIGFFVQEGLYTVDNARMMSECYVNLIREFADNTDAPAANPPIFNSVEVDKALKMGRGPETHFSDNIIVSDIDEIILAQPNSMALKDTLGNTLSYREMNLRTHSIAKALNSLGVGRGSRVGIFQEPTIDWICSMLGIWRVGATFVPLELDQGTERVQAIIQHAELAVILVHNNTKQILQGVGYNKPESLINLSILSSSGGILHDMPTTTGQDEAMILYTSGSTGLPKGISLPHNIIRATVGGYMDSWKWDPQIVLQHTALSFDHSWQEALIGLVSKGSVVVTPRPARKDPVALINIIATEGITMTTAVPSQSTSWLQYGGLDKLRVSNLAWLISGGESMGFPLIELFQKLDKPGLRLLNMYGPAEVMVPTMCEIAYRNTTAADMPLPVGPVRPNYIAYVVDNQDHPVPAGVPGELIVGGAGVGLGYINDLVLTAKKFQHDRFATPRAISRGWTRAHRTGDRVYLREHDGVFVLLGRITGDLQVKIRGQRLDVREVESSIIGTSGGDVVDAVVNLHQGEDGKIGSDSLVARVVLSPAATVKLREGDVRDGFLAKLVGRLPLPSYMLPSVVVSVPSLPLNKHGKVDRLSIAKLPLPSRSLRETEVSTSIQTTDQQRMKEIWDYVLGDAMSQSTGPASDFFLVGGNSLLVITLQAELKERYRLDIPLTELFQRSTLGQMAELLQGKVAAPMQVDWETETKVDDNVRSMQHIRVKPPACENVVVVLTGATGFLGRHLLRGLISSTRVKAIHCVAVREPSKLRDMASPKVVIYSGDLRSPLLGLTEGDARTIFTSTDVIVHNGADVSFLKSYTTMRGANVASTKELVRLALLHRSAERLHFVSTAGVAALNMEELYEVPLPGYPPADSSNGYVVSKWACENYLENAFAATGLPVTIHRPTAIMGPGAPRLDVMHNVLHFAEKLRTVPEMQALEGWFQFVDIVDIAGDMVGDILGTEAGVGGVLYRNHSGTEAETVQISRLREYLTKKHSVEFTMVDDFEWVEKASTVGLAREIGEYLRSIGDAFKHGSKWVFPRVWKGTKNDRLRVT